ncbi:MAG TPA: roadblock/LC7 domain-containing protein [Thermomicrobiaceae bacterium]|nr:roadblock/LC7 domain-containing protein [Thermomicrobiaceae bacterium]
MNMEGVLIELLDYRDVLGAVATTTDGLVIAAVGIGDEDAEVVAAAGSTLGKVLARTQEQEGDVAVRSGEIHVVIDRDLMLVTLTEPGAAADRLRPMMRGALERVGTALHPDERPA